VLDELVDVLVAFGGDGDDAAAASGDLLNSSMSALGPCFISPAG
jgi:hypothetical protein